MPTTSKVRISSAEEDLLYFLWRHRVSTFHTLKNLFYPDTGIETAYNRLRKLRAADYVKTDFTERKAKTVWCLGERGMRLLEALILPDLKVSAYKPKNKLHDLLAMSALLGDWYKSTPDNLSIVTEQELIAVEPDSIPGKLYEKFTHRPDGLWVKSDGLESSAVALELEMNGKAGGRYEEICSFYGGFHFIENVIWIVPNKALARKIQTVAKNGAMPREGQHVFLLLDDFEENLWNAILLNTSMKGKSMSEFIFKYFGVSNRSLIEPPIELLTAQCALSGRGSITSPLLKSSLSLERLKRYKKIPAQPNS
jgi:hypothetical protein